MPAPVVLSVLGDDFPILDPSLPVRYSPFFDPHQDHSDLLALDITADPAISLASTRILICGEEPPLLSRLVPKRVVLQMTLLAPFFFLAPAFYHLGLAIDRGRYAAERAGVQVEQ